MVLLYENILYWYGNVKKRREDILGLSEVRSRRRHIREGKQGHMVPHGDLTRSKRSSLHNKKARKTHDTQYSRSICKDRNFGSQSEKIKNHNHQCYRSVKLKYLPLSMLGGGSLLILHKGISMRHF